MVVAGFSGNAASSPNLLRSSRLFSERAKRGNASSFSSSPALVTDVASTKTLFSSAGVSVALERARFFVWRANDWHPVSAAQDKQIKKHMKAGETAFDVKHNALEWRIEFDAADGAWVQVNKQTGRRRRMKVEETAERWSSARMRFEAPATMMKAARRLSEALRPKHQPPRAEQTLENPSRSPCCGAEGGLLGSLREEWRVMAGGRKVISRTCMAKAWREASGARGSAIGSEEDVELLTQSAEDLFNKVDLSRNGKIEEVEWLHYRLLEIQASSFHALAEVNELLIKCLEKEPNALEKLLNLFESCLEDQGLHEGHLSAQQMRKAAEAWKKTSSEASAGESSGSTAKAAAVAVVRPLKEGSIRSLGEQLDPCVAELDEEEVVTYYDFMNIMLGRRKVGVQLYLYDLSGGKASWLSPILLGQQIEGVWHSAVVVHGREFWYGGRVLESPPGRTQFGHPTRIINLGHTMRTKDDLLFFIKRELLDDFTVQSYDVLTNNCNHFSNEVCRFLTNTTLPDEVLKQPSLVTKSLLFQAIRPLLNWSLGCFGEDGRSPGARNGIVGAIAEGFQTRAIQTNWQDVSDGSIVAYEFEAGWMRVARVTDKQQDTCDLQWFDSRIGKLQLQRFVDRSAVHPLRREDRKTKHRPGGGGIFGACYHPVNFL